MDADKTVKYPEFVRMVAKDTGFTIANIEEAIRSMEKCMCEVFSEAAPGHIVTVRFLPHGDATRYFARPSKRTMPTGKIVDAGGKMRTIVRFKPFLQDLGWLKVNVEEGPTEEELEKAWYEEDDF